MNNKELQDCKDALAEVEHYAIDSDNGKTYTDVSITKLETIKTALQDKIDGNNVTEAISQAKHAMKLTSLDEMREGIDHIIIHLNEAQTYGGWLDIESAPKKDGEPIILFCPELERVEVCYYHKQWNDWRRSYDNAETLPTHWKPIPLPPQEDK